MDVVPYVRNVVHTHRIISGLHTIRIFTADMMMSLSRYTIVHSIGQCVRFVEQSPKERDMISEQGS